MKKLRKLNFHLKTLDCEFKVEVYYDNILRESFALKDVVLPYKEFLDLIKYITFFHQKNREWYEDKEVGKKYLLAHQYQKI